MGSRPWSCPTVMATPLPCLALVEGAVSRRVQKWAAANKQNI